MSTVAIGLSVDIGDGRHVFRLEVFTLLLLRRCGTEVLNIDGRRVPVDPDADPSRR